MKERLKEIVSKLEMVLEYNEAIIAQLQVTNKNYESILSALKELEETASIDMERGAVQDIGKVDNDLPESLRITVGKVMADDLEMVANYMEELNMHVQEQYVENNDMFRDVKEIYEGYKSFTEFDFEIGVSEDDVCEDAKRKRLSDILINQLGEYGWANNVLIMCAYSKMEQFKFIYSRDVFNDLSKAIISLYEKYNVKIFTPEILSDVKDASEYDFTEANYPRIEQYCNISPGGNTNNVYDLVKVGYVYKGAGEEHKCKPEIFSYRTL